MPPTGDTNNNRLLRPRARTVKPGPRHLRTRPDPGQTRLGPHMGVSSGQAHQATVYRIIIIIIIIIKRRSGINPIPPAVIDRVTGTKKKQKQRKKINY